MVLGVLVTISSIGPVYLFETYNIFDRTTLQSTVGISTPLRRDIGAIPAWRLSLHRGAQSLLQVIGIHHRLQFNLGIQRGE